MQHSPCCPGWKSEPSDWCDFWLFSFFLFKSFFLLYFKYLWSIFTFSICQLYTRDSSKNWKQVESEGTKRITTKEPSANVVLLDFISSEKWNDIVDFDDHLDDISK